MSCCGNKRQSLNFFSPANQALPEPVIEIDFNGKEMKRETLFLFTGKVSLEVKGLFGNQRYLFTEANPLLAVLPEDTDMMRAYPALVEVKD